jgi:thiamine pyrophosphate-dependent acetolactate synthase large subunit-like protein
MPPRTASIDFIAEKLELIATLQQELARKFDQFQDEYRKEHQRVVGAVERAHSRLDIVEREACEMQKEVREIARLMPWVKAMAFLTMGLSIPVILAAVGFIWAILTHQISLFP